MKDGFVHCYRPYRSCDLVVARHMVNLIVACPIGWKAQSYPPEVGNRSFAATDGTSKADLAKGLKATPAVQLDWTAVFCAQTFSSVKARIPILLGHL